MKGYLYLEFNYIKWHCYSYILTIILIIASSCSKTKIEFNVNSSLLGETYLNQTLSIKFKIPKHWNAISDKEFKEIQKKLENQTIENFVPLRFYINRNNGGTCIISSFTKSKKISNIVTEYEKKLRLSYPDANKNLAIFYKDKIKIYQFQIVSENLVNIKLIFSLKNNSIIQIDYLIGLANYKAELRSIESSIGSIEII